MVSDRYSGSTIAYQGYGPGLAAGWRPGGFAAGGLAADLSILVDVEVDVAAARLSAAGGGGPARAPGNDFAARVREGS